MTAVHQGEWCTALQEWKQAGKETQSCLLTAYVLAFRGWNSFLLDKPRRIYLKEMPLCVKRGHLLWVLEEVCFDLWTQMAIAPHQGPSYLSGADIEPANRGDRRDLSLTRTIPLITDWNWILFFFLCWMHFLICLVFIAFKKAICYIVHQPSR